MIAQRCRAALVAELAIACQSSVFFRHLNEAAKLARISLGSAVPPRGANETITLASIARAKCPEAIHGRLAEASRALLIMCPSAASSAGVASHSLHGT